MNQKPGPEPLTPPRVVVLIPARNEATTIARVVQHVKTVIDRDVVVIDDASTDATASLAGAAGATVLPLPLRLGAWGATQTGIRYALRTGYQIAVTMDADGQHDAAHIEALMEPIVAGAGHVVIGACPGRLSRARRFAWSYFRLLTGLKMEDITSGFRAYDHKAMKVLASARASLLDYQDVGVLLLLRRKRLSTIEIPVAMNAREDGGSRIFSSWWVVGRYLLQTSVLSIARIGMDGKRRTRRMHNSDMAS